MRAGGLFTDRHMYECQATIFVLFTDVGCGTCVRARDVARVCARGMWHVCARAGATQVYGVPRRSTLNPKP
jgi:hypothetical protein